MMTSSTKSIWAIASAYENLITSNLPLPLASLINRLSPLMTNENSDGYKGNPCFNPLEALKNSIENPLIRTTKFVEETHAMI